MVILTKNSLFLLLNVLAFSQASKRSRRGIGDSGIIRKLFTAPSAGKATYHKYTGNGACSYEPLPPNHRQPGWISVAGGDRLFQGSLGCGTCVEVRPTGNDVGGTTPIKRPSVKAVIIDRCVGCTKAGVDMFIPGTGVAGVLVKAIDCPKVSGRNGNIMFRYEGSNPWYLKIQVLNARLPTLGMEVHVSGYWHCMVRSDDAHFIASGLGKFKFPLEFRLTSITGERLTTKLPRLQNDVDLRSSYGYDIQYTKFKSFFGQRNTACHGQGSLKQLYTGVTQSGPGLGGIQTQPPRQTTPSRASSTTKRPPTQPLLMTLVGTTLKPSRLPAITTNKPGVAVPIDNFCRNRNNGLFPHPHDKTKFINCSNSTTHVMSCPPSLVFKGKQCDWP